MFCLVFSTHSLAFKHPKTLLLHQLLFLVLWLNNEWKRLQEGKFHLWLMVWGVTAHHDIEDVVAGGGGKWRAQSSFAFFLPPFSFSAWDLSSRDDATQNSELVFSPPINLSGNTLTDVEGCCLLGDDKTCQADDEDYLAHIYVVFKSELPYACPPSLSCSLGPSVFKQWHLTLRPLPHFTPFTCTIVTCTHIHT